MRFGFSHLNISRKFKIYLFIRKCFSINVYKSLLLKTKLLQFLDLYFFAIVIISSTTLLRLLLRSKSKG